MTDYRRRIDPATGKVLRRAEPEALPARAGDTLIGVLVDRSGSMSDCLEQMQMGLNKFLTDQATLPGGAAVTLAEFDNEYKMVWPMRAIESVPRYRLVPRGGTALLDSMGRFIGEVAEKLTEDETYRPVIIAVLTDGQDNCSREWTKTALTETISYWRDNYGWKFVFLGANIDAVHMAGQFGIPPEYALTFDTARAGASWAVLSKQVAALRAGNSSGFTEADRRKALGR